ncbi:Ubiquitin carboxyl-terminal hydrolase [Trichophyton interdigitale]|uniref:ubiquitinyl hydrolase 1 n=1 Tax=Trichophyton interdigitale TaxID=101480 RepID=A0A9P4YJY0_9EURO|nr:Ubiquitin carboxyl-terminal hydrolase [Trichophyton interdigitale]KAF3899986.1 Ubiquitin carboxyl-terminal hydrolase [Trichophyton interdigitale]KAG8209931.1 Ubiquitin carboxyl-terminal hydrolase [Trichophyton interdigitale]
MSLPAKLGKTAPLLIQDVLHHDPASPTRPQFNILKDVPPIFYDKSSYPDYSDSNACVHRFITKPHQSVLPANDSQRVAGARYQVSSVCQKCRLHLELAVVFKTQLACRPGTVHHFCYFPKESADRLKTVTRSPGQALEVYVYSCTQTQCSATVHLKLWAPLIKPEWVSLLTDEDILKKRVDDALALEPERLEGIGRPTPLVVLTHLKTYIDNALYDEQRNRSINIMNKKFTVCFGTGGESCKELFEYLGFKLANDRWEPPRPNTKALKPYTDPLNVFLDNISFELLVLISQRPQHETEGQGASIAFTPSISQFNQLLGTTDYPKTRAFPNNSQLKAPFYEHLGAVSDMSNELIIEAYRQQNKIIPSRNSYYLRCLRSIGHWRDPVDGKTINDFVELETTNGKYADDDVPDSYSYFNLDYYRDFSISDDAIIGSFYARLEDTPNDMEPRKHLWRIGDYRKSEKIKAAAEERVTTAEQAEVFLGVHADTPDDFVISMYTAKISDSPDSKEVAKRAVRLIADSRKSEALQHFLKTGEAASAQMDIGDAFRLLQIPDRSVDDAAIIAAYSVCCSEAPEQIDTYRQALAVIAEESGSAVIRSMLVDDSAPANRALLDWPVGLRNIGNTCYLNSLLQFYFTIQPFRNMVLDLDRYKTELDEEVIRNKKVGSRKVSLLEIQRSQKFLVQLKALFNDMITSPDAFVTPTQELARLTLLSSSSEAAFRRKSLSTHKTSELGEINGIPIMGPVGPPAPIPEDKSTPSSSSPEKEESAKEDAGVTPSTGASNELEPGNASDQTVVPTVETKEVTSDSSETSITPEHPVSEAIVAPSRPPPVPPRPAPRVDNEQLIREEVELGAQQDVTEVINNVLFQAQCAIKPTKIDADGNQIDLIMDLFYGQTKSYITAMNGIRSKNEFWSDIKVDVATGSRDIYSAIDGAFDRQKVHVDGADAEQYGAISKIPPVLQIQVQRVQFDQVKKSSFKSTHHLELKETIYMDRYMDVPEHDNMGLYKRRREKWAWNDELNGLKVRREELLSNNESLPDLFQDARDKIQDLMLMKDDPEMGDDALDIDEGILTHLSNLEVMTRKELIRIDSRMEQLTHLIDHQFADMKSLPYHLYAVFIHHGSVEFGHYYIYIFDFEKKIWRKYNDSEVTEVHSTAEIFSDRNIKNPPTPYFLVYLNDGLKERLAKPVCRHVEERPARTTSAADNSKSKPGRERAGDRSDVEMADLPPSYDEAQRTAPDEKVISTGPAAIAKQKLSPSPDRKRLKRKGAESEEHPTVASKN